MADEIGVDPNEAAMVEAAVAAIGGEIGKVNFAGVLGLGEHVPQAEVPQGLDHHKTKDGHTRRALAALGNVKDQLLSLDTKADGAVADAKAILLRAQEELTSTIGHDGVAGAKSSIAFGVHLLETGIAPISYVVTRLDAEAGQILRHMPITTAPSTQERSARSGGKE